MMDSNVTSLRALADNFIHVIRYGSDAIAVDPADAAPVASFLKEQSLSLSHILITHHHADHTAGCRQLQEDFACRIIGPDDSRVPDSHETDTASLPLKCDMIPTPGHTSSHVCYYFAGLGALFSGDTLFLGGCGRLFESSAKQMWSSLLTLRRLPPETNVFPGHDYTFDNLEFCESVFPNTEAIKRRLDDIRANGAPPCASMKQELATNVFLMCDDPHFTERCGLEGYPADIFAELRRRKDAW